MQFLNWIDICEHIWLITQENAQSNLLSSVEEVEEEKEEEEDGKNALLLPS